MNETKFLFSDEEFLGIVNIILKVDTDWEDEEYKPITSMDDNFNIQGLDSLSVMMFFIWVSDFFGTLSPFYIRLTCSSHIFDYKI